MPWMQHITKSDTFRRPTQILLPDYYSDIYSPMLLSLAYIWKKLRLWVVQCVWAWVWVNANANAFDISSCYLSCIAENHSAIGVFVKTFLWLHSILWIRFLRIYRMLSQRPESPMRTHSRTIANCSIMRVVEYVMLDMTCSRPSPIYPSILLYAV